MAATYEIRRGELTTYFDRTAAAAWEALTSDAPVSRIRATVRAGRTRMRDLLLARLPADMTGLTLLDAGCGTGALAVEAARRGARVTAVDVSPRLIDTARERLGGVALAGSVDWRVGDMLDPIGCGSREFATCVPAKAGTQPGLPPSREHSLGMEAGDQVRFDHVVAMDSLIHYREADIVAALAGFAARTRRSILFTVAPRTPLLSAMHAIGKLFPRGDRAPAIEPVASARLARLIACEPTLSGWMLRPAERITSGFYLSEAHELVRR